MSDKLVNDIIKRAEQHFSSSERNTVENMWNELSEYFLNNQSNFNRSNISSANDILSSSSTSKGAKKTRHLFDSTGLQVTQDLASAFQGTLTNPATVWSKLRFQKEELNEVEEATKWLEDCNHIIHNHFNESNFDTEIAKGYQSYVALANLALFHEQRDNENGTFEGFRFTAVHLSQLAWAENKDGIVDTVFRKFEFTAKQAFERWGAKIGDELLKAMEDRPDEQFQFLHAIYPRDKRKVKLNKSGLSAAKYRPFASCYVGMNHKILLEEGGYYEMPLYVSRWGLMPGEKYGRGPAHLALPDVRTLNRIKHRGLEALDLQIRPPILVNQRDIHGQFDMRPGGVSVLRDIAGVREFVSQSRADLIKFSVEELRTSIKSIFFLDKLLLPDRRETGEMTAFEVSQRIEQMQRVLGPTLSRLNSELLQPLIIRAFKIMLRAGALPEIPSILQSEGVDVEIVFVNQLARAQQQQDISSILQWTQNLAGLAQVIPQVLDNIDADGIARHSAKILGVPDIAVTSKRKVEEIRQERSKQQQQQQALAQANMAADTAAKAGNIQQGPNSLIS